MDQLQQAFTVRFEYPIYFTEHLFDESNNAFCDFLARAGGESVRKIFFVIDDGVARNHPDLTGQIENYLAPLSGTVNLVPECMTVPGGERSKNTTTWFEEIVEAVERHGIDRHSYIAAIGGGSVLDLAGYAAAVSHRGIRHIRIPTTVLSQNDSGVGVKNGINYFNKKNFLGTFAPPAAVFNDFHFLTTLSDAEWISGTSEAVKVALIKDLRFFHWLEEHATRVRQRDKAAMQYLVYRCAELHLNHIAGGDPFEMGSSRPLDFGHWSAHKVEPLSNFEIRHGEAVALGIALDSAYSFVSGRLSENDARRVVDLLEALGFAVTHPLMEVNSADSPVLLGLQEFREHLGGRLTVMLLEALGKGVEVHELDPTLLKKASVWLQTIA